MITYARLGYHLLFQNSRGAYSRIFQMLSRKPSVGPTTRSGEISGVFRKIPDRQRDAPTVLVELTALATYLREIYAPI